MRVQEEHTPHASWSFGVRQFKARATSRAKSFLPIPSSPVNSSAPGSRSAISMRFSAALTRSFPVSSANIVHREVASTLKIRNDDLSNALLRAFHWSTGVDQLDSLGFGEGNLQIRVAHASVKVGIFDIETVGRDLTCALSG